jgi:hypothetical protein
MTLKLLGWCQSLSDDSEKTNHNIPSQGQGEERRSQGNIQSDQAHKICYADYHQLLKSI